MAVFRVEKNRGYTVMSNHHLRNKALSLKAKGLLSQMLSLPEDWDYTLKGLSIDAIRTAVWELEKAGYIRREQGRDPKAKWPIWSIPSTSSRYWKIQHRLTRCWKIRHRIIRRREIQRN